MPPQAIKQRLLWLPIATLSLIIYTTASTAASPPQVTSSTPEGTQIAGPTDTPFPMPTTPNQTPDILERTSISEPIIATAEASISTPTPERVSDEPLLYNYVPQLLRSEATHTPTPTATPPAPPESVLFCDTMSSSLFIPDNNPTGASNQININDPRFILDLNVYIDISHTWVSDLTVYLTNLSTNETQTLIDRPGYPQTTYGCSYDNIIIILDDGAEQDVENQCYSYPAAISGAYRPNESVQVFTGNSISGPWRLRVVDSYANDIGYLNKWCLEASVVDVLPSPTPTPPPITLPTSAMVSGISGEDQQLPLDCESRSAVDWAAHYGVQIDELDFYYNLPHSDDPDEGFVGNVMGIWGQIPPADYGVHAQPIATLLNEYGLTAFARRSLDWDRVRTEIANGDPVIAWIIGGSYHTLVNGIPRLYTAASNGHYSVVAAYEHTVIVIGYNETQATVLNGGSIVTLTLDQFLDSWSALWNMAVLASP